MLYLSCISGRLLVRFDRRGNRIGRLWIQGRGATMPEQPRATISFSSNDVSVFGVSINLLIFNILQMYNVI
jgi:hypothetical protein